MPGRKYTAAGTYRYGFNGKENDNDITPGAQDYGLRIYDKRLRRLFNPTFHFDNKGDESTEAHVNISGRTN